MLITEKKIREIIKKNLVEKSIFEKKILTYKNEKNYFKKLKENVSNAPVNYEMIGNNCKNNFIKELFKNQSIGLYYEKNSKNKNKKIEITEIKYSDLNQVDVDLIWEKFANSISIELGMHISIAKNISKIFMKYDKIKNEKIFEIFNEDFPIQSYEYSNSTHLKTLSGFINSNKDKSLYQELYRYHESSTTFNTGKGEYLCVLLTKGAESGGTDRLDVVVGNGSYDLKQITNKSSTLKFTLSAKSGVRTFKNEFIDTYRKIGEKIFDLKDEFKKLGVDENIINAISQLGGQVGSSFKKDPSYVKMLKGEDVSSLGFGDINEAFIQAIRALRRRTYVNVTEIQNDIKTKFQQSGIKPDSFNTNTLNISNKITGEEANKQNKLNINNKNWIPLIKAEAKFDYTPQNKIRNIDEDTFNKLNDIYGLELKAFKDISDKDAQQLYSNVLKQPDATVHFWKIDTKAYNQQIESNIIAGNIGEYFKLDEKYSPMIFPYSAGYFTTDQNKEKIIDNIKTEQSLQDKLNVIKNIANSNIIPSTGSFSYSTVILPAFEDIFNMQVVLTVDQMKKLNKIIEGIEKYGDISKVNTISSINDEYLIVEPLKQDPNQGEFVIDVSFYKNKRKRHIDTLHSSNFEIDGKSKIVKTGKEAEITQSKDIEKELKITLTDVISDKEEINRKLKEFNLFNTLQPSVLEHIFTNKNINVQGKQIKLDKIKKNTTNSSEIEIKSEELSLEELNNNQFISKLKEIKEKTGENNIINLLYDLYNACDELEKKIKSYYANKNHVMVMKDDGSDIAKYSDSYSWTDEILGHSSFTEKKGFITSVVEDGILCQADKDKYEKQATVKDSIFEMLNQVYKLSLDVQSLSRA